jgi:uncharacterized protein (TIGR03437 family)
MLAGGALAVTVGGVELIRFRGGAANEHPFQGGKLVGELMFEGEGRSPLDTLLGDELDGRRFTDLSHLDRDNLDTPTGRFYVRTRASHLLDVSRPWSIRVASPAGGTRVTDTRVTMDELKAQAEPQLFQNGGIAAAIDATTYGANPTPISASNPAHAGDSVQLYGNGLRPVYNQPASGAVALFNPLPATKSLCTVTVGGQNAPVSYCGLAGYPAEHQINITVPSGLAAGNQPVVLTTGGISSKTANLPVKQQ